jgi:hypothetical protein
MSDNIIFRLLPSAEKKLAWLLVFSLQLPLSVITDETRISALPSAEFTLVSVGAGL